MSLRVIISERLASQGLELLGVVALGPEPSFLYFQDWLKEQKHGEMRFLENYTEIRRDPRLLLEGASTALIIGLPYAERGEVYERTPFAPKVAQYARFRDYHKVLREQCEVMLTGLKPYLPEGTQARILVDSAPVLERALAAQSIKGFIGKNTLYIHPQKGSFFLLAEVFLTCALPIDPKTPVEPHARHPALGGCGSCKRCQVFCPTGALSEDYKIDARKCLAYYSIEYRGCIPLEFWPHFKWYWFGCDICQLVCPYNREAPAIKTGVWQKTSNPSLFEVATMDQAFYEKHFGGTPMTRAKREGLIRNSLIAMTVTKDPRLKEAMQFLQHSPHPLIQGTLAQIPQAMDI